MVDEAKKTLLALNVVLDDEEAERASAITVEPALPAGLPAPVNEDSEALAGE